MARKFREAKLVLASHNRGKAAEIADLLAPFDVEVLSAADLGLPEPEETGTTFIANAELKARAAAEATGLVAVADDSGLAALALDGAPGIYSARWAGPDRDFDHAMRELQAKLDGHDDRRAQFVSALTLAWPDGHVESVEGRVDGTLVWPPRGDQGFGYDPMFVPAGHERTFGEMPYAEKKPLSHRSVAFAKLIDACFADD